MKEVLWLRSKVIKYAALMTVIRNYMNFLLRLTRLLPKKTIYSLENKIKSAYGVSSVRIFPHYPAELFSIDYIDEIIAEAKRIGIVTNGFLDNRDIKEEKGKITLSLPFGDGGMELLETAKTAGIISSIIKSEFSLDYEVEIKTRDDYAEYQESFEREKEAYYQAGSTPAPKRRGALILQRRKKSRLKKNRQKMKTYRKYCRA